MVIGRTLHVILSINGFIQIVTLIYKFLLLHWLNFPLIVIKYIIMKYWKWFLLYLDSFRFVLWNLSEVLFQHVWLIDVVLNKLNLLLLDLRSILDLVNFDNQLLFLLIISSDYLVLNYPILLCLDFDLHLWKGPVILSWLFHYPHHKILQLIDIYLYKTIFYIIK